MRRTGPDSPGKEKEANWLPAPDVPIYLVMRLYWPKHRERRLHMRRLAVMAELALPRTTQTNAKQFLNPLEIAPC